jgi:hypothetical protein
LSNEDYDGAKVIKMEMDKLRAAAVNGWVEDLIRNYIG